MTRLEKIIAGMCIGLLVFLSFTIIVRFTTRQILVKHFNMDNAFTELVWFDNATLSGSEGGGETEENTVSTQVEIDWEERYPFANAGEEATADEMAAVNGEDDGMQSTVLNRITNAVTGLEDGIQSYTSDLLVGHEKIVEGANVYEKCIGWNFTSFQEYNGVVTLSDGYLSGYTEKRDTTKQAEAMEELKGFCEERGIGLLYVMAPYKIREEQDKDVSGTLDFSNQNADEFLSRLDAGQFDYQTYEKWLLGSQGRKVTLARCEPDDFTLLYPKYETAFHYIVPGREIDMVSDYSVVYDMSVINKCDYYNSNPYTGCNYGEQPLIQIENQLPAEEHKILMIRDSFGDCVISCLALAEKNVDSMDIRYFTGSVRTYIEENDPDLVIVMYNAGGVGGELDDSGHDDIFDFR
jgi:hypothetical protein